jgi:hypothetical protein
MNEEAKQHATQTMQQSHSKILSAELGTFLRVPLNDIVNNAINNAAGVNTRNKIFGVV